MIRFWKTTIRLFVIAIDGDEFNVEIFGVERSPGWWWSLFEIYATRRDGLVSVWIEVLGHEFRPIDFIKKGENEK